MQGWILLHRKFLSNFLWTENRTYSKAEAWIDILFQVRFHEDQHKAMIKGALIACDRGQSLNSLDTWASRWNWSKSATRRFLLLLKREGMILIENVKKTTRLTVCNYETYQTLRIADEPQVKRKRNAGEPQAEPEERRVKKGIKEKKEKKTTQVTFPKELDTPEFHKAWKAWTQHRKELKKTLTPSTMKMQLKKLARLPVSTAMAMLEQSIQNGWTGIFTVKENDYGNGQTTKTNTQKLEQEAFTGPSAYGVTLGNGAKERH